MKRLSLASILVVALLANAPANAADAPRAPVYKAPVAQTHYDWTGFYLGGNAGYGWGHANDAMVLAGLWLTDGTGDNVPLSPLGNGQLKPNGFVGGLQAGYNHQAGRWVLGIEADANYFGVHKSFSRTFTNNNPGSGNSYTFTSSFESDWLVTLRPRLGHAFDRFLIYVTGGLAIANQKLSANITQLNLGVCRGGIGVKDNGGLDRRRGGRICIGQPLERKSRISAYRSGLGFVFDHRHLPGHRGM